MRTHDSPSPAISAGTRAALLAAVVMSTACDPVETVREHFRGASPHENYAHLLRETGLAGTALGHDWLDAADRALQFALPISLPFRETGYIAPEQPAAIAYRWTAQRGQRLAVRVELEADSATLLFIDLFRLLDDSARTARFMTTADSGTYRLEYEHRRTGEYLLRVQPELLRGGHYSLRVQSDASLAFPVAGHGTPDIGSRFGAARDGGRRRHHGIDIFARRGTPVVAAAEAVVSRVRDTPIGGKVVWLRDERRGQSLYYAHLDSQLVAPGSRVRPGDTIGLVGNTGNARTTPPHLHFGIYSRGEGPIDPFYFVYQPERTPPRLAVDSSLIGRWTRTAQDGLPVLAAPADGADILTELPQDAAVRVLAGAGRWYRVRLPDGTAGFVAGRLADVPESGDRGLAAPAAAGRGPVDPE